MRFTSRAVLVTPFDTHSCPECQAWGGGLVLVAYYVGNNHFMLRMSVN